MNIFFYLSLFALAIISVSPREANAQANVVFRINVKQQLKDSIMVPPEDEIVIRGNQIPFSRSNSFELKDKAPADSIYTAEVNFPYPAMGKNLEYRYIIKRKEGDLKELRPRFLTLKKAARRKLPVVSFNDFRL